MTGCAPVVSVAALLMSAAAIGATASAAPSPAPVQPIEVDQVATPTGMRPVVREVLVRFDAGTSARAQSAARTTVLDSEIGRAHV